MLAGGRNVDSLRVVQGAHGDRRGGWYGAGAENGHGARAGGLHLGSVVVARNLADELNQVTRHQVLDVGQGNKLVLSIGVHPHHFHASERARSPLGGRVYDKEEGTVSALNRARRNFRHVAWRNDNSDGFHNLALKSRRVLARSELRRRHVLQRRNGVVGLGCRGESEGKREEREKVLHGYLISVK